MNGGSAKREECADSFQERLLGGGGAVAHGGLGETFADGVKLELAVGQEVLHAFHAPSFSEDRAGQ